MQDIAPLMQWRNIVGARSRSPVRPAHLPGPDRQTRKRQQVRRLFRRPAQPGRIAPIEPQPGPRQGRRDQRSAHRLLDRRSIADLDRIRTELRGIMQFRQPSTTTAFRPKVIDIAEDDALIEPQAPQGQTRRTRTRRLPPARRARTARPLRPEPHAQPHPRPANPYRSRAARPRRARALAGPRP